MEWLEFEGASKEEAISKALKAFGVEDAAQLETQEVKVTRKFLGMGGRTVKIKARLIQAEEPVAQKEVEAEIHAKQHDRAEREHEHLHRPERPARTREPVAPEPAEERLEADVVTMESRYRPWVKEGPGGIVIPKKGRGFGRRIFNPDPFAASAQAVEEEAPHHVEEEEVVEEEHFPPVTLEDVEGSPVADETRAEAENFVRGILEDMGIKGEVKGYRLIDRLHIQMETDSGGLLIGRKGETLEALQYLTDLVINRKLETRIRIVLDTENYRDRKRHKIVAMAKDAAEDAIRTRRAVALPPMNPAERRIIHTVLAGDKRLTTKSEGEGSRRRVVVHPAGDKKPHKKGGGGGRGGFGRSGGRDRGRDHGRDNDRDRDRGRGRGPDRRR